MRGNGAIGSVRRALGAGLVLGAFLAAAGCGGSRAPETAQKPLPEKVVVLPFEDLSGGKDEALAREVTGLFVAQLRLARFGTIGPEEAAEMDPAIAGTVPSRLTPAEAERIGSATGCEAIVIGAVTLYERGGKLGGDRLGLRARVVDARTGRPIGGATFSSETLESDTMNRGIDQLTQHGVTELADRLTREPK